MRALLKINPPFVEYPCPSLRQIGVMKKSIVLRLIAVVSVAGLATNCTTTSYDAYGNPKQTVDPGVALLGAAAVGLVGYALADDHRSSSRHHGHGSGYRPSHYSSHYSGHTSHSGHYRPQPYRSNHAPNYYPGPPPSRSYTSFGGDRYCR